MKTKLTLALVALITSSAFAGIPKVLPEFKNAQQLAEWRDEMTAKHATTTTATDDHAFYTGKPYIESTGSYAFKYRSYNPELARWTSEDPSGFPDGANSNKYAPNPTSEIDLMGLLTINTSLAGSTSHYYLPSYPLGSGYTVKTKDLVNLSASNFSSSFSGWTFDTGSLGGGPITWKGELYYGKYSVNNVTIFGGVAWEFSIYE